MHYISDSFKRDCKVSASWAKSLVRTCNVPISGCLTQYCAKYSKVPQNCVKIGKNSRKCGENPLMGTLQVLTGCITYETETLRSSQKDPDTYTSCLTASWHSCFSIFLGKKAENLGFYQFMSSAEYFTK